MEFFYRSVNYAREMLMYGLAVVFGVALAWAFFYSMIVLYRFLWWFW